MGLSLTEASATTITQSVACGAPPLMMKLMMELMIEHVAIKSGAAELAGRL